jgi:hypothetical protein
MSIFRKIIGKQPASVDRADNSEREEESFSTKGELGPRFLSDPGDATVE